MLFDFAAAAKGCRDILDECIDELTARWRDKQLQYTWLRALQHACAASAFGMQLVWCNR
jgi:hypothetical protein